MMMMLLQEKMNLMRASCFVFLVVLLCRSVVICSGYQRREENVFLSQLVDPMTEEVNEELAKLLWISCRVDLIHLKQVVEDEYNLRSQSWDANLKNLENVLHLHLKTKLLDCIRENNLLFDIIREEGGSYITSYLESLFTSLDAPQQNLGRRLRRSAAEIPGPVSGPAPAPVPASGHTPTSVPAPTKPFFPFYSTPPPPLLFDEDSSATSGSDAEGPATKNNQPVIIAVAITAAVTFLFAALLFFCCMKCYWKRSAVRQNDESPLLSLSMTDYSIGSVNSVNGEKFGHQSLVYNSSHDMKASSFDGKQNLDSNIMHASIDEHESLGAVGPALKPPPGRVVANPPGMPPLKPPPGRVQPLPPERPAYLRPSATSTGPPVPPPPPAPVPPARPTPPVPPPPMKPSSSAGPPPPRPPAPPTPGAPPPPPPKAGPGPPRPPPPLGSKIPRPPPGLKSNTASGAEAGTESDADHKAKLKPFFWDKVLANPDSSMVWHQIKAGSFQFNEEMIETLFGYTAPDKNKPERKKESSSVDLGPQYIQIIDHKKSQNLSIMLRALNVTIEEVCDALIEGNELPVEFLQALLKMAPTSEEELKLRLFTGEVSQLGPADRFLKALVDIPFSFKRIEALLFMCTLEEEVAMTKESFQTLEVACKELRNSRLFLKLLEAVLKTGNRMNNGTFRGGAQAFKLDTLLKLADVKGTDGKTTLLHFVVQEIIRTEGVRAARAMRESQSFSSVKTEDLLKEVSHDTEDHYGNLGLQVVSRLSSELENVKKASALDAEGLTGSVAKLNYSLSKTRNFLNSDMKSLEEDSGFHETLKSFVENAEGDVKWLVEEEKRIMGVVKSTGDYFHGNAGKDEGLRLFTIVRDFLVILDKVCRELREAPKKPAKTLKKESSTASTSSDIRQNFIDPRQKLFPAIAERRMDYSSSDDDMS